MEPDEIDGIEPSQPVATVEPRQPWDKQPDESAKAFDAFCRFRDAEKRSFKSTADLLNCSTQNVWQWATRHNWKLRADAWDIEQDRLQRAAFARDRTRMRERHLQVARSMLGVAAHGLREWQMKIEQGLPLGLQPEQIALLTKCAVDLEARTIGMDREQTTTEIHVLFRSHKYAGEQGSGDEAEEWKSQEAVEREQYARLTDDERRSWERWKDPPKPAAH